MNNSTKGRPWAALAALLVGGCSPSDQFWKKPDVGEKFTVLDAALMQPAIVRNLDLYGRDLQGFPEQTFTLTNLERLGLRKNAIRTVPDGIAALTKVYFVDLGEAGLTNIPAAFGRLPALTTLYLNDNALTVIPAGLGDAAKLMYLNLDRNKLTALPPDLGKLSSLKWLRLNGNQLTALPSDVSGWTQNLKRLYLKGNPLPESEKDRIRKALPKCDVIF